MNFKTYTSVNGRFSMVTNKEIQEYTKEKYGEKENDKKIFCKLF